MDDKVQRYDHCSFNNVPAIDGKGEWVRYVDISSLHAAIIDLIDKTLSCTSGLSYGDCLEEIKRRLANDHNDYEAVPDAAESV